MKRILLAACLCCAAVQQGAAQTDYVSDDAGKTAGALWTEIGATKVLPYNLSLGLDAGFRTNEWFNEADRFDVSLGLDWKPAKHWKFGISYTLLFKHYPQETAHKTEYKYRAVKRYKLFGWFLSLLCGGLFVRVQQWYGMRLREGAEFFMLHRKKAKIYNTFEVFK